MTLRQKITIAFVALFLCMAVVLYGTAQFVLHDSSTRAEDVVVRENISRIDAALEQRFANLAQVVPTWSDWDELYQFTRDGNDKFRSANLSAVLLAPLHIDLFAVVRFDGKVVYALHMDQALAKKLPLPPDSNRLFSPDNPLMSKLRGGAGRRGLVSLGNRLAMVVTEPVQYSNGRGPVQGVLFMGRWLNEVEMKAVAIQVQFPVEARRWEDAALPTDFRQAKKQLTSTAVTYEPLGENSMVAYLRENDIYGQPALLLRAHMRRDIYRQGNLGLRNLQLSLVLLGLTFCYVAWVTMDRLVLRRLEVLNSELKTIGEHSDFPAKVSVTAHDELADLARQINTTLTAMRDAQGHYERMAANVPGIVFQVLACTSGEVKVTYVSEGSRAVLGLAPEELAADPNAFGRWVHPADLGSYNAAWSTSREKMEGLYWEGRLRVDAEREMWIHVAASPEEQLNGDVVWDGLVLDISDSKIAEEALVLAAEHSRERVAQNSAELSHAQISLQGAADERRLVMGTLRETMELLEAARAEADRSNAAKSIFLSRMSHELRTPMNAILGFSQLLEMDDLSHSQREKVGHVLRAGQHLLTMIDEVLDITRIESGTVEVNLEAVPLEPAVAEALNLLHALPNDHNVAITVELGQPGPVVQADRQRLVQVMVNLISNAVKYNRPGGTVRVTQSRNNGNVRISVADTGIGIEPDMYARMFTPFDRLGAEHTTVAGTGIGLLLTRRLAELMDGSLGSESTPGVGSTFWVELPAAVN